MTRIEKIRKGVVPPEARIVAEEEGVELEELLSFIRDGKAVILLNSKRKKPIKPVGIGKKLRTKVNVNIGTSPEFVDYEYELKKLEVAEKFGADTIMDLSVGGDVEYMLQMVIEKSSLPVGTVPVYTAAVHAKNKRKSIIDLKASEFFDAIISHAEMGVDFMTIHCGVTKETVRKLKKAKRLVGVVSRGGSMMIEWMAHNKKENPFYENFDEVLSIAREYDITLSLGDGLRPGAIADASDKAQFAELELLGELIPRALEKGVQVMVEGPGHIPIHEIEMNVKIEKEKCREAPFYVLGPIVTDVAPGYDHITSAIGGAVAAMHGVDFLCYVTPAEHLRLPTIEDVKEGLIAAKIAAHVGDIAKGIKGAKEWDKEISFFRKKLDWEKQFSLAIDREKPRKMREERPPSSDVCTMCGEYCPLKRRI
jgi:phosphomethylpyrimidine synthase